MHLCFEIFTISAEVNFFYLQVNFFCVQVLRTLGLVHLAPRRPSCLSSRQWTTTTMPSLSITPKGSPNSSTLISEPRIIPNKAVLTREHHLVMRIFLKNKKHPKVRRQFLNYLRQVFTIVNCCTSTIIAVYNLSVIKIPFLCCLNLSCHCRKS